jgi:dTDP-4-dehydrorhamnose 3,5-epimerase
MRVTSLALPGPLVVEPAVFRDGRGFFLETYRADKLQLAGIADVFVQANQSRSVEGTLRGLHWQWRQPQAKLVRVVSGSIFDAVVDIRRHSPTFGRWCGVELTAENFQQLYVPVGFAHGFCVLSAAADVEYLCSAYYDADGESGIPWNDPSVGIEWPLTTPTLSKRDQRHPPLNPDRTDLL